MWMYHHRFHCNSVGAKPSLKIQLTDMPKKFVFFHVVITGVAKGPFPPEISSISCHFVLCEVLTQTKYCCSLKVKRFGLQKHFGLATPLSDKRTGQKWTDTFSPATKSPTIVIFQGISQRKNHFDSGELHIVHAWFPYIYIQKISSNIKLMTDVRKRISCDCDQQTSPRGGVAENGRRFHQIFWSPYSTVAAFGYAQDKKVKICFPQRVTT